jgi:hypothetical protein
MMRPQAYALLAFTEAAHGQPAEVKIQTATNFNFNAYAYKAQDGSVYLTLINKSYGDHAQPAVVSLQLPAGTDTATWQRMDLTQKDNDIAAKTDVTLGGAAVNSQGNWPGQWKEIKGETSGNLTVQVAPTSATILHFSPAK